MSKYAEINSGRYRPEEITTAQVVEASPNLYVAPDESDALANSPNPISLANPVADKNYVDAQVNVLPRRICIDHKSSKVETRI